MSAVCRRFKELGLNEKGFPLLKLQRPFCEATTRNGTPCKARVIPGKRRCRLHGGASTGPTSLAGRRRIAEAQQRRWQKWRAEKH
ncbi:MAG: HGGxSTG domain-containing protein [Pseudomonadota bacterium]